MMKRFYILFLGYAMLSGTLFTGCSTYDELDEPAPESVVAADVPIGQSYTADGDPIMTLGEVERNPYAVQNMLEAYNSMPSSPMKDRVRIRTTHWYIKFCPTDSAQYEALMNFDSIDYSDYPLDREVLTEGIYIDPVVEAGGMPTLYAVVPVNLALPNVPRVALDAIYFPQANELDNLNDVEKDPNFWSFFSDLENRAYQRSGHGDKAQYLTPWLPSGRISVYDEVANQHITLPRIKIRIKRWWGSSVWRETLDNGTFECPQTVSGLVQYSIDWNSTAWEIRDGMRRTYYNSKRMQSPWYTGIQTGIILRLAHIHRALLRWFSAGTRIVLGIDNTPVGMGKIKATYLHEASPAQNYGWCNVPRVEGNEPFLNDITTYKADHTGDLTTDAILGATIHQLAHMVHMRIASQTFDYWANSFVREGWAAFVERILVSEEYQLRLGRDPLTQIRTIYNQSTGQYMSFELPNRYNRQGWVYEAPDYDVTCPMFIDLHDNSNQRDGALYLGAPNYGDFVNDVIKITNIRKLQELAFSCSTVNDVKVKINQLAWENYSLQRPSGSWVPAPDELNRFSEQDVTRFFEFYPRF